MPSASGSRYRWHMIIECPSCAKRYRIADDAVPAGGRTVRCAACKTAWFQPAPEPTEPIAAPAPPIPAVSPESSRESLPSAMRQPPAHQPARSSRSPNSGVAGNLALGALATGLALLLLALQPGGFRGVDLGRSLDPEMPGSALTLELHEPIWGRVLDGRTVLTIAGKLSNPTPVPLVAPPLVAEVRDADRMRLAQWTSPPPVIEVPSGATITFDTATIGVSASARTVTIKFAQTRRK